MAARFENFDDKREPFSNWFERFNAHLSSANIPEPDKVNYLISCLGADTYAILRRLSVPKLPSELTFDENKKLLENHFNPKPLVVVSRFHFRRRFQGENENFSSYLAALRELASNCEFTTTAEVAAGTDDRLNEELRDQIVQGIRDKSVQTYYLQTSNLTLQMAIDKAKAAEISSQGFSNPSSSTEISIGKSGDLATNKINERIQRKNSRNNKLPNPPKSTPVSSQGKSTEKSDSGIVVCFRCAGKNHRAPECKFKDSTCNKCNEVGHLATVCGKTHDEIRSFALNSRKKRSSIKSKSYNVVDFVGCNQVSVVSSDSVNVEPEIDNEIPPDKVCVNLPVNDKTVKFEADTGAPFSLMSINECKRLGFDKKLRKASRVFASYNHSQFDLLGIVPVKVRFGNRDYSKRLRVVDGNFDTMLGRDWLYSIPGLREYVLSITPNNVNVNQVSSSVSSENYLAQVENLVNEFADIFVEEIGSVPNVEVDIPLKPDSKPVFCHARPVPYAIRPGVEKELDRLIDAGVLKPVVSSDWATPIVPVRKANGSYRITGDYSVSVNRCAVPENYPIPYVDDILNDFTGCRLFSKFDIRDAFLHLRTTKEASKIITLNTSKGLLEPTRMFNGLQLAPTQWQKFMDAIVRLIKGANVFYDDVKISSRTIAEHLQRIRQFFELCRLHNIRLNKEKCQFLTDELNYLGYKINAAGIHKTTEKIDAIVKAPRPTNQTELKSFTGMVGYYARFFPKLSELSRPFNLLSRKDAKFVWNSDCERAFNEIKAEISSDRVLTPFNPAKQLVLATDASPYAIGTVLSHIDEFGERPIAFASRTLTKTEERYSQIDKEALGIYWGVKKFFNYLFGRPFILETDCKPLQSIFDAHAAKPSLSATRLLHYALFLQDFNYTIKYRRSADHANADFVSRFPVSTTNQTEVDVPTYICQLQIEHLPVSAAEIATHTQKDDSLVILYKKLRGDVPAKPTELREFSLHEGCIFRGERVYIPSTLRQRILRELHQGHLGIEKTKALARSFVYWPGLDKEIASLVADCARCKEFAKLPAKVPTHPWEQPSGPWRRIHVDIGQLKNDYFLIIVDAYSKWIEVYVLRNTDSDIIIKCFGDCFARFGVPEVLVSDNGPQFVSADTELYLKTNGILHLTSPAYFPASNGLAERAVQTVKKGLHSETNGSIVQRLNRFLQAYRRAPHSTTGVSPAELFFGRKLRTPLSLVVPTPKQKFIKADIKRSLSVGQAVRFRLYQRLERWSSGKISKCLGNVVYEITDSNGVIHKRHINQILVETPTVIDAPLSLSENVPTITSQEPKTVVPSTSSSNGPDAEPNSNSSPVTPKPQRPQRQRRPPHRYSP
ncbi:uncharacterized protein K02A2.6-like [Planococcus citri]|uniref:uncharacterized protein K02A2.6-like n=1 Tax=Planococcus citri TaxID=170843 RepID=UPI0031F9AF81